MELKQKECEKQNKKEVNQPTLLGADRLGNPMGDYKN